MSARHPFTAVRSLGSYGSVDEDLLHVLSGLPGQRDPASAPGAWKIVDRLVRDVTGRDGGGSPLSPLAGPGHTIVVKPNFVRDFNECPGGSPEAVVTPWGLIYPLIDMALECVGRSGRVVLADAPMHDCSPERILARGRWDEAVGHYASGGFDVSFIDLRQASWTIDEGVIRGRRPLKGDPSGYVICDLAGDSEFEGLGRDLRKLRGTSFDDAETRRRHSPGRHEYLLSRTVMSADLVINAARLKTHGKIGITGATKNIVGINGDKNWLPHWRAGFPGSGGDQYPSRTAGRMIRHLLLEAIWPFLRNGAVASAVAGILRVVHGAGARGLAGGGAWRGNDTTWRMVCDLNKALLYCDASGKVVRSGAGRKVLHLLDAVEAGQGEGPLGPEPVRSGFVGCSSDPVLLDSACARLVGLDPRRIPYIVRASAVQRLPFTLSGAAAACLLFDGEPVLREELLPRVRLRAPRGWAGAVEMEGESGSVR